VALKVANHPKRFPSVLQDPYDLDTFNSVPIDSPLLSHRDEDEEEMGAIPLLFMSARTDRSVAFVGNLVVGELDPTSEVDPHEDIENASSSR
jgi:hypothetical protein